MNQSEDFFSLYARYTEETECPTFYHRWVAISCLAASLGRNTYVQFGHFRYYPNLYIMFLAASGTKKSTAIKIGTKVLKKQGFKHFSAKKTRQEKFLIDLAEKQQKH